MHTRTNLHTIKVPKDSSSAISGYGSVDRAPSSCHNGEAYNYSKSPMHTMANILVYLLQ